MIPRDVYHQTRILQYLGIADPSWPNYVDKAVVPFFLTSLFTEIIYSKWKEARMRARKLPGNAGNATSPHPYFRLNDTLNSLSTGTIQQVQRATVLQLTNARLLTQMLHLTFLVKVCAGCCSCPNRVLARSRCSTCRISMCGNTGRCTLTHSLGVSLTVYARSFRFDESSWLAWILCFFAIELGSYW